MKLHTIYSPVVETINEFRRDNATSLAAALAFYTIFSMAPILVIVTAVAGRFLGREAVRHEILAQIQSLVGPRAAHQVGTVIQNATNPYSSTIAAIIGLIALLIGSTAVFSQLKTALNTVWNVEGGAASSILSLLRDRLLALAMVLGIAFLLLVSLVLEAALSGFGKWTSSLPFGNATLFRLANWGASILLITLLFAMIYKVLPDARISWKDVWVGSFVTALLFSLGKYLIGLYLGRSTIASVYGAAGSLAIILVWIYYSSVIFLFGAEFTQVYARHWGSRITSQYGAEPGGSEGKRGRETAPARNPRRGNRSRTS